MNCAEKVALHFIRSQRNVHLCRTVHVFEFHALKMARIENRSMGIFMHVMRASMYLSSFSCFYGFVISFCNCILMTGIRFACIGCGIAAWAVYTFNIRIKCHHQLC